MLLAVEGGEKDVQEKALNFLPFPSKPRAVFCFWTSISPRHFPLSTSSLCQSSNRAMPPFPREPPGVPAAKACPLPGGGQPLAGGSRTASPLPAPVFLVAAFLFSLARATGCDARFLLSLHTRGRGPKGMVGSA